MNEYTKTPDSGRWAYWTYADIMSPADAAAWKASVKAAR